MKCLETNKLKIQPRAFFFCFVCLTGAIILSSDSLGKSWDIADIVLLLSQRHLMIYSDVYPPKILTSVFLRHGANSDRGIVPS